MSAVAGVAQENKQGGNIREKSVTTMKSNAPWSVKGIERDARETAKEAAKREGMTVGEWLNQMIYSAGDPDSSGGNVEGLKLRDIVTAIDHLHKRIADSSAETGDAVTDVSRKMGDIVERVQRLERAKPAGGDRERVDALKALEKAVSQVAVQFSNSQKTTLERLDATEASIQKLTSQVAAGAGADADAPDVEFLKNAIDGLQSRMTRTERLAGESAEGEGDAAFRESTSNRLRVLGDEIKRGGDQIRTLEQTIGKLSKQIEAAERRSAEGVQKTAETLTELREKFSSESFDVVTKDSIATVVAEHLSDTSSRIDNLQASLEKIISRLSEGDEDAASAEIVITQPDQSHDDTLAPAESDISDEDPAAGELTVLAETDEERLEDSDHSVVSEAATEKPDDDDDYFSFADEIDASIDEAPASDREDGFSFELDDTVEDREGHDPAGAAILSEVQKAFADTTPSAKSSYADDQEPEAASDDEEKASVDRELDELLAGLDDIGDAGPDAETNTDTENGDETEAPPFARAEPAEETSDASPSKEDLLKSIRRKAREEAAARAAGDESARPTRRKLTPKQKAILAARARRKRLAEKKGDDAEDAIKAAATKKALEASADADEPHQHSDRVEDDEQEETAGHFAAIWKKLPFLSGDKDNAVEPALERSNQEEAESDREAMETLKSTASARPVTLALGIGIFLAIGVIFFAVRDFVFSPRDDIASDVDTASIGGSAESAGEPSLEAPEPPTIDPITLYRDAMTGLNAAGNDAETGLAIEKLEQAAMLGHPPAQLQLGELYKTGQGVDQDLAQARTWFRRAANGGNVLAMHRVGVMTARGDGGSANTPEAINWFEQAANRGLVDSQYNLGAIYHPSGEGETGGSEFQDAGKAYYWYSLAAKNGDEQAKPLASGVGAALSEAQRAELDDAIAAWSPVPADVEANTLANAG